MNTYKIIKGTFHVKGYSPDGDSIRFEADDHSQWDFLKWSSPTTKRRKKKQLRIEAIDTLETHYENVRQPNAFAIAALERMLEVIGISDLKYNLLVTKITSAKDGVPGFIATAAVDVFGRPICYVFPQGTNLEDGLELTPNLLPIKKSINYILIREGIVYPTFYTTTEESVVELLTHTIKYSRRYRKGLWAIDRTMGFTLHNVKTIQEDVIIFPKLFRRFVSFFKHRSDINTFMKFLEDNNDPILLNDGTVTDLRDIMFNNGNEYGLLVNPEHFKFIPKG